MRARVLNPFKYTLKENLNTCACASPFGMQKEKINVSPAYIQSSLHGIEIYSQTALIRVFVFRPYILENKRTLQVL